MAGGSDTIGLGGTGDSLGLLSGTGYVVNNNITGDQVNLAGAATATVNGSGGSIAVSAIDSIYNQVLCRDMSSSELASAEAELATGTSLNSLEVQLANSAEARADMASTYAAVGDAGQLDAQPQCTSQLLNTDNVDAQVTTAPTQTEFNAFADAMSTSYGAPIELFSVDPASGAETVLADTSATNLLAELPVLETEANGANLGLQLADGTQIQFASTARAATFLYSLAVQQMQATSFVTDNYNLDMQWLNTVDQPLLDEASYWSERATAEASAYPERTIEDNTQASMALQIAAEAPGSRQNMSVTIKNAATGNPTQITVYANGSGSSIHDVAPSVLSYVESAVSTVVDIAAVVTGQYYLYYAAAAIDAAEAGQAFSNGQDLAGILSLAQALSAGITGGTGGTVPLGTTSTVPLTDAQVAARVISVAAQGVGGVYGVVQSAQNGNALGILAGALEAAAAAATGIGLVPGNQTQTLSGIAAALGAAGIATSMASDFASGNLAEGLVDSLNLYLPAVAAAYGNSQNNQENLQSVENADAAAAATSGNANTAPAPSSFAAEVPPSQLTLASTSSLTTTIEGVTATTEIGTTNTPPASGTTQGGSTAMGTIGIAVQPGVPGMDSAAQNGTANGDGSITLPPVDIVASRLSNAAEPTIASLFLQALQFISPAEAAPSATAQGAPSANIPGAPSAAIQAANLAAAKAALSQPNVKAFLATIATAEGGSYGAVNSGVTTNDLSHFPAPTKFGSAAGEYQITSATYAALSAQLGLTDWSQNTQDLMAAFLLQSKGVVADLQSGTLGAAITSASGTWAAVPEGSGSLDHSRYTYTSGPNAGQYQPSMPYQTFVNTYQANGGH